MAFGVYVHIPFCTVRCDYCDFATWDDRAHLIGDYLDACVLDLSRSSGQVPAASSIFFGGGTPSLLAPEEIARVLEMIPREDDAEVTLEANPDTVDVDRLAGYAAVGVTRLTLGVQSTLPHVLEALGRVHRPEHVAAAIGAAREVGFDRVGVDLVYGASGESLEDWRRTIDDVLELGVDHVSAYALTIEEGAPLARRIADGEVARPDDDHQADEYLAAESALSGAGLEWYEISNWARAGHECRHNLLYWEQGDYLGVGAAAHGHANGRRWWNVRSPEEYIDRVSSGESPEAGSEQLGAIERAEEGFALALRTRHGAAVAPAAEETVGDLVAAGMLVRRGDRLVLTVEGRLVASDLTVRLLLGGAVGVNEPREAAAPRPAGTRYH